MQLSDLPDGRRPADRGQGDSPASAPCRIKRRVGPIPGGCRRFRAGGRATHEQQEEVARLLGGLQGTEAEVVRMFHLEGKGYHEISDTVGMPENSIGPILSRARNKIRRAGVS